MATVERTLERSEWRILVILGVPTFALALGITTVSTYLPVIAEDFSASSIVIGLLIGGEGLMALWLPLVVGSWSDRLRTPLGSRLPFIIAATPPLVIALAVLGYVQSIAVAAVVMAVFFVGYFVAYDPIARSIPTSSTTRSPAARRARRRSSAGSGRSSRCSAAGCSSRSPIRCRSSPRR
jgi:MFS family permease